jgi:putative solute:sodium symporter small subunit
MAEAVLVHMRERWAPIRQFLLVMLAAWICYFLLVNFFIHRFDHVVVPILGIPLGVYLALQGATVVFAVTLFRFRRELC